MSKNIEMNYKNSDGSYEILYPNIQIGNVLNLQGELDSLQNNINSSKEEVEDIIGLKVLKKRSTVVNFSKGIGALSTYINANNIFRYSTLNFYDCSNLLLFINVRSSDSGDYPYAQFTTVTNSVDSDDVLFVARSGYPTSILFTYVIDEDHKYFYLVSPYGYGGSNYSGAYINTFSTISLGLYALPDSVTVSGTIDSYFLGVE